jgi:DNA repair protein RadC
VKNAASAPEPVCTAADAEILLRPLLAEAEIEAVFVLYLDAQGVVLGIDAFPGCADTAGLPLREVMHAALRVDARRLVLAHSHPSGDPSPSQTDIETTRTLAQVARRLGITLVDHLIFAAGQCTSLKGEGLL